MIFIRHLFYCNPERIFDNMENLTMFSFNVKPSSSVAADGTHKKRKGFWTTLNQTQSSYVTVSGETLLFFEYLIPAQSHICEFHMIKT